MGLIVTLAIFCVAMLGLVIYLLWSQRQRLQQNQQRIAQLQEMLEQQYQHRVSSIQIIVKAMAEEQCEYTEGCIRLYMLMSQLDPSLFEQQDLAVIKLMYTETEHMPIKEDWKSLDKKVKTKLTNQRIALENQHKQAIGVAVCTLQQHQFPEFKSLT